MIHNKIQDGIDIIYAWWLQYDNYKDNIEFYLNDLKLEKYILDHSILSERLYLERGTIVIGFYVQDLDGIVNLYVVVNDTCYLVLNKIYPQTTSWNLRDSTGNEVNLKLSFEEGILYGHDNIN